MIDKRPVVRIRDTLPLLKQFEHLLIAVPAHIRETIGHIVPCDIPDIAFLQAVVKAFDGQLGDVFHSV